MNLDTPQPTGQSPAPELNPVPQVPVVAVNPEVAVTPPGPGFTPPPTPETNKPTKKKLIVLASVIGGAVLLLVIGIIVYVLLTNVSQNDYKEASSQFNAVSAANSSFSSDMLLLSTGLSDDTDDEFNESVKGVEASITTLRDSNAKLGDLKAVRVGEGQTLYKTFDDKLAAYVTDGGELLSSVIKVRPALITCDKISGTTGNEARIAAMKACSKGMNAVKDVPNAAFKAYVVSLEDGFAKFATIYERIAALTDPYGSQYEQYKTLRDENTATQKAVTTAQTDFVAAVKKHDSDFSVKESADNLSKYLSAQQE